MKGGILWMVLFVFSLLMGCQSEPEGWQELDLIANGLPISIKAPDSAQVKTMDMGILKDVTIKKGEDFHVQILASEATTSSVQPILKEQRASVESGQFFSRIIREDESGFLYETMIDSLNSSYGFCYVFLKGNREFIFQSGLIGIFSEEEAQKMYEAVQQQ
jgi:hypothetical protein